MNVPRVLITDGMSADGVKMLESCGLVQVNFRKETSPDSLAGLIGECECVLVRSATRLTPAILQQAKKLKLIVRAGAGLDNIDLPSAKELGIQVQNTANANALAAAEHTIALMFALSRHIPQAHSSLKCGKWDRETFKGVELTGKTLGVIGLGNIGKIVAQKALGLGMRVLGYDPVAVGASEICETVPNLEDVLTRSNFVTLHIPKTKQTENILDSRRLNMLPKGARVINCARGGLIEESALISALDSGHLAGAAIDVFREEPPSFPDALIDHPKIIVTPHLGASTVEAQDRVGVTAAKLIIDFFSGSGVQK